MFIQKTDKTYDVISIYIAQQMLQLNVQTVRLKHLIYKKQKKVAVDSNETFANIPYSPVK